jgi:hypothetical protein
MNYQATFTRYSGTKALRQISGLWLFHADSFREAYDSARLFMQGMQDAGEGAWSYEIVSLETTAYTGERISNHGPTIWQGPEDFTTLAKTKTTAGA